MWRRLFILCAIVGFSFEASAINCFLCESVYEEKCGEDFELENHFKFDCARVPPPRYLEHELPQPNATGCMKKLYAESGVQKIIRSCFFGDVNETSLGCRPDPALTATILEISCHVCDSENYCNAAPQHPAHSWTLLGAAAALLPAAFLSGRPAAAGLGL